MNFALALAQTLRLLHPVGLSICALLLALIPVPVLGKVLIGVNVANPQWVQPTEQDAILDQLTTHGVTLIRVPLRDDSIDFIIKAHRRGISTSAVIISIANIAHVARAPYRKKNPAFPKMWPGYGLSSADPEKFRAVMGKYLDRLDKADVKLAAIEIGNEINWAAFNRDFPLPGKGILLNYRDLKRTELGRKIAQGYRTYIAILKVTHDLRASSAVNHHTPIISAGLANKEMTMKSSKAGGDAVRINATMRYLREQGIDQFVDAYGVHYYPSPAELKNPDMIAENLRDHVLAYCRPGRAKPCWITEWGLARPVRGCETNDPYRVRIFSNIVQSLAPYEESGRVRARTLFTWSPPPGDKPGGWSFSVTNCGKLTDGGRTALSLSSKPE